MLGWLQRRARCIPAEGVQMHKKREKSFNSSVRSKPKSKTNEGKGFATFTENHL